MKNLSGQPTFLESDAELAKKEKNMSNNKSKGNTSHKVSKTKKEDTNLYTNVFRNITTTKKNLEKLYKETRDKNINDALIHLEEIDELIKSSKN